VDVVPTRWMSGAGAPPLADVLDAAAWREAVMKPVVSATAHETFRFTRAEAPEGAYRRLLARGEVLVQPFLREIVEQGEWSLVFIGGTFSHAVLKRARPGDFRVQEEWGGTAERGEPPATALADAQRALGAVAWPWLYARVDGCVAAGRFHLTELEMLEPTLYLDLAPDAPARFADAIVGRLA
jgi:hypothetical protein